MKSVRLISRLIVGLVFIFSGFVKGVDPLGTAFQIEEYLVVYHLSFLIPLSLACSVFLCAVEFSLGVFLVLNLKPRLTAWILLLMMSFFTILTFYDAIYEPVADCGCFGDAIILTNWQTFYKNIMLMVPTLIIFVNRSKATSPLANLPEWVAMMVVFIGFMWFSVFNYRNLPMIDFLAWKVGNKVVAERTEPMKFYLTYRNKQTGETKQYLSPDFPYDDPEWMEQWEFVSQCVIDPNPGPQHNLRIFDMQSNDMTQVFLEHPGYQFILVIWKAGDANHEVLRKMNELNTHAGNNGISLIAIAPEPEQGKMLAENLHLNYEFFYADDVELKIMVRSNPGLVLLKQGVVIAKWSHKNIPTYDEVLHLIK